MVGAKLLNASTPGFQFKRTEWLRIDEENENKIHFRTATRGRINNLLLELDDVDQDTRFHIVLEQGMESGTAPIRVRPFAAIPSADLSFPVSKFREGTSSHEFQVGRHRDYLTLRFIDAEALLDREFEFTDTQDPMHGDYYYLRIRQLDGALAWSSPFWVGGETPR